jgi:hypothetical protein
MKAEANLESIQYGKKSCMIRVFFEHAEGNEFRK